MKFTDYLDRLFKAAKDHLPVVIERDFNVWAVDRGSKKINRKENKLLQAMSCIDIVLLNTGNEPTNEKDEKSSIVVLTLQSK